jgi:hypothetical protein
VSRGIFTLFDYVRQCSSRKRLWYCTRPMCIRSTRDVQLQRSLPIPASRIGPPDGPSAQGIAWYPATTSAGVCSVGNNAVIKSLQRGPTRPEGDDGFAHFGRRRGIGLASLRVRTGWAGTVALVVSVTAFGCTSAPAGSENGFGGGENGGGATASNPGKAGGSSGSSSRGNTGTIEGGSPAPGSSGSSSGSQLGGPGGNSSASRSGTPASSGSGSGGSSGMSGDMCSDAGAMNNPEIDYSSPPVTLTMTSFDVPPGQEVYYCQTFANPWGKQVDIKNYTLNMNAGSHHMFAFYQANATDAPNAQCTAGGITFAPFTFSAQTAHAELTYPATIGATLPATTGFLLNVHYINTGAADLQGAVGLTMYIAKPGVVTNPAGALFLNQIQMTVDPSCTTTSGGCQSSSTFKLPQDVNILAAASHMHRFATHFIANTSTGITLYETTEWAEPPWKAYCPPLHLTAGTSIAWQCTDVNDTGSTLTFGEYANSNVMCISSNIFYPVTDVTNPVVGSQF